MTAAQNIAFGGSIPILFIFILFFSKDLQLFKRIACVIVIYVISLLTGIFSGKFLGVSNGVSALTAGIFAPIIYCVIAGFIIKRQKKTNLNELSD